MGGQIAKRRCDIEKYGLQILLYRARRQRRVDQNCTACTNNYILRNMSCNAVRSARLIHYDPWRNFKNRTPPLQHERVPQGKVKEAGTAEQAVAPQRAADG